jgi:hypothetical protein
VPSEICSTSGTTRFVPEAAGADWRGRVELVAAVAVFSVVWGREPRVHDAGNSFVTLGKPYCVVQTLPHRTRRAGLPERCRQSGNFYATTSQLPQSRCTVAGVGSCEWGGDSIEGIW